MNSYFEHMNNRTRRHLVFGILGAVYFVLLLVFNVLQANPYYGPLVIALLAGLSVSTVKDAAKTVGYYLIGCVIGFTTTFLVKFLMMISINDGASSYVGVMETATRGSVLVFSIGLIPWIVGFPLGMLARRKFFPR